MIGAVRGGSRRGASDVAESAASSAEKRITQAKPSTDKLPDAGDEAASPTGSIVPTVRFNRAKQYGGAQTDSPAGRALREAAEGTPCPSCGKPQISGTKTQPVPEHHPSLLEHHYDHGGHAMTDEQRRAYARSPEAFDRTRCLTCQRSQGGVLSRLSRWYKAKWGL
jgi:hypothetical protein